MELNKLNEHFVVAININKTFSVLFKGNKDQCRYYVKKRAKMNQPTHYIHVIKNSERAIKAFHKKHQLWR